MTELAQADAAARARTNAMTPFRLMLALLGFKGYESGFYNPPRIAGTRPHGRFRFLSVPGEADPAIMLRRQTSSSGRPGTIPAGCCPARRHGPISATPQRPGAGQAARAQHRY